MRQGTRLFFSGYHVDMLAVTVCPSAYGNTSQRAPWLLLLPIVTNALMSSIKLQNNQEPKIFHRRHQLWLNKFLILRLFYLT